MKRFENIVLAVACVVAVVFAGWYYYIHPSAMPISAPTQRDVNAAGTVVHVDVVSTEAAREQGLSGRSGLAPNSGMLFVFDSDATWGIWMKDMKFSIDIVWLTQDGTVITVAADAAPDSYPQVFKPTAPAHYVLELPAGFAAAHGIGEGAKIVL